MLKLLERAINTAEDRIVLVAPEVAIPDSFQHVEIDGRRHHQLVREMQQMRGRVYLHDGAITEDQLSADGRHVTEEDDRSWHLLTVSPDGKVTGCAWYLEHPYGVTSRDLRVRHTPLARTIEWRERLWTAASNEIARAHRDGLNYVEVGGWAVSPDNRCTSEGLMLALAGYSLGRICGGCLGMTTATVRHCSSTILRRIGGERLALHGTTIPAYYDPRYRCEMEILTFDSRRPSAKFAGLVEHLRERLMSALVVARTNAIPALAAGTVPAWSSVNRRVYHPAAATFAS